MGEQETVICKLQVYKSVPQFISLVEGRIFFSSYHPIFVCEIVCTNKWSIKSKPNAFTFIFPRDRYVLAKYHQHNSIYALQWRRNECDGVSNHQPHDCSLNHLFNADHRQNQSSASLAFVWGIHRSPVNSPRKWPITWKKFPCDDVMHRLMLMKCVPYFIFPTNSWHVASSED